jgi:hypothetical protein
MPNAFTLIMFVVVNRNLAQPRPERKPALHQRRWIGEVVTSTRRGDSMRSMEGRHHNKNKNPVITSGIFEIFLEC